MRRNDYETPWDGCPKCGEWVRFGFLTQTCPCGWSLDDAATPRNDRLLEWGAKVAHWLSVGILAVVGIWTAADLLGEVEAPLLPWAALLASVVVLSFLSTMIRRALGATIGGGRRGN